MNPLLRRAVHGWARLSRGVTLGVRAAAIDGDGRVCLVRHTYTPGWQLPGGGVETGETAGEALARELAEEAALELTGPGRLHGVYFNRRASRRDHVLLYEVRDFRVAGVRRPDWEIAAVEFFPLTALPPDATPATRARLAEIAAGTSASDW